MEIEGKEQKLKRQERRDEKERGKGRKSLEMRDKQR